MFRLTIKDPEGTRKLVTERTQILVGRRVGVDVCLQDITVSRNHCLLRIEGDRVRLMDLSSAGGTLVRGKKIAETLLEAGAIFELGKSRVCLEAFRTSATGLALEPPEGAYGRTATTTADPPKQVQLPKDTEAAPAAPDGARRLAHAAASEFGRELRVILNQTPWYTISVALHAIIILLLHMFTTFAPETVPRDAAILAQAPSDGGEIEPDTVTEEPEIEEPELEPEVLEEIDDEQREEGRSEEDTYIPPPVRATVDGIGAGTELLRLVRKKRVAKIDDKEQVRTNVGDFHRRAREIMEGEGGPPRGVRRGALVVTKGDHDSVERVLDEYHLPYKLVTLEDIVRGRRKLLPGQLLFVNCHQAAPHLRQALARKVRTFVNTGGWMVTTDWAIDPFVVYGFPGRVKIVPAHQWGDITVSVKPTPADPTLLRGVFRGTNNARWWLESSSTMFKVMPGKGVRELIVSDYLHKKYRTPTVACEFWPGKGRVVHVLGHLYQEDGNLQGMIAMHRMLFNLIRERYPDAEDRDRDH